MSDSLRAALRNGRGRGLGHRISVREGSRERRHRTSKRSSPRLPPHKRGDARLSSLSASRLQPEFGAKDLFGLLEIERGAVDAIAKAGRLWPILEHMAEMRVAFRALNLGAAHQQGTVLMLGDLRAFGRLIEGGPAAAGLEFGVGREQRRAAADAVVKPGPLLVVQRAGKGVLRAVLACDLISFRRKLRLPLGFTFLDSIIVHQSHHKLLHCGHRGPSGKGLFYKSLHILSRLLTVAQLSLYKSCSSAGATSMASCRGL